MAPMLATPTYDYDAVPSCFFSSAEEEEFYPGDMWKKFELLPTPPSSPSRTPPSSEPDASPPGFSDDDGGDPAALLQPCIIQDCMWSSSFAAASRSEAAVSERSAGSRSRQNPADPQVNPGYSQDLQAAAADCIDPSEVFPYAPRGGAEPSSETPPLSSGDSQSEEDEEDEEVDVETVDRQTASPRPDASPSVVKRCHVDIQQHNYAAPRPAGRRRKAQSGGPACGGAGVPRQDGEDEDRRRTHNVLERRRRSESRLSFSASRDQVPASAQNPRAAKVSISKRAAEFIREVRGDERKSSRMKEASERRSGASRRRSEQLRTLP